MAPKFMAGPDPEPELERGQRPPTQTQQTAAQPHVNSEKKDFKLPYELGEGDGKMSQRAESAIKSFVGKSNEDDEKKPIELTEFEKNTCLDIMFKGFAIFSIPLDSISGRKGTFCSMTPADYDIISMMVNDYIMAGEEKRPDGEIGNFITNEMVHTYRGLVTRALTFIGFDGRDFVMPDVNEDPMESAREKGAAPIDATAQLTFIKRSTGKANNIMESGDIIKYKDYMTSIKKAISKRISHLRQYDVIVLDIVGRKFNEFNAKLNEAMNREGVLPKS